MLERNIIDRILDFLHTKWTKEELEKFLGNDETIKQYLAFQFMHGNVMWVNDKDDSITGVLVSYTCDEDEVGLCANFNWDLPKGKNCIFVAELASADERSRNLLAHGFLQRYPTDRKTYAVRKGSVVPIKAHDISKSFTKNIYGRR